MVTTDLISRAAALEAVRNEEEYFERAEDFDCMEAVQGARWRLQEVPTIDAIPVVWLQSKSKELRAMGEYQQDCADSIWFVLKLWEMEKEAQNEQV